MTNVLFTGLTGFLGKNFISSINDETLNVFPLSCDVLASEGKLSDFQYNFNKTDIEKVDILVHAGAFSPKTREQMNDIENNILNATNTAYLLKNLPSIPKKIIYISSISVSDNSIYGLSKLMSEKIVMQYAKQNNIDCQILRLGVMYGNNKGYQGLVPTFIENITQNKSICVFNDGAEMKNFVHVEDVCKIIYQAIKQNEVMYPVVDVINTQNISVKEIAQKLIAISGKNTKIESLDKPLVYEYTFDATIFQKAFKLTQKTYDEGLKYAFDFFAKGDNERL